MQQGTKISQMIKVIELAWDIKDQTNDDYERVNLLFSKLLDRIHEYSNLREHFNAEDGSEQIFSDTSDGWLD